MHRFITLRMSLELLADRAEVKERGFQLPDFTALTRWIQESPKLSNDLLAVEIRRRPGAAILRQAYDWSLAVNEAVGRMVHGIPPFPYARACLEQLARFADIVIVSATQEKALEREWAEHRLDPFVSVVCGQETGGKADIIAQLRAMYPQCPLIMIGDAPGDMQAAHVNGSRFYPILPGNETASWHWLHEHMSVMADGAYDAAAESARIEEFNRYLPSTPPWQRA